MAKSEKVSYTTSPEIKESKELLVRVRDFYMYALFDVLKLGIPASEQLSKALTKITGVAHKAAGPVETLLREVDAARNTGKPKSELHYLFVTTLDQQFGISDAPNNFIVSAKRVGRFVFEKDKAEYFEAEIDTLYKDFMVKKLGPYKLKHGVS